MTAKPNIPQTISLGFGTPERSIPRGLRGTSVLVASGNAGVGQGDCRDIQGNVRFYTVFPASCPWVTSVGGTKLSAPNLEEVATPFSGGGFSAFFMRNPDDPNDYQSGAVATFEILGTGYPGHYNPNGRGVPDIALQSSRYQLVFTDPENGNYPGQIYEMTRSGTACSTITAAAIFSLLNDYRISNGIPPLGFLNPWLYGRGRAGFYDITSGTNPGCNTPGFSAVVGWDPITGLGSPDFPRLQALLPPWPPVQP
jgi:tripeptidyl-peptidase-1